VTGRSFKFAADVKQVIDYTAHSPVHAHLAKEHGLSASPFDLIIDCYGIQDLWTHCASYLSPKGAFITVGVAHSKYTVSSILYATSVMLWNSFWPTILGGVNRPYVCVQGFVTLSSLEKLRDWVEKGELDIVIDSVWKMEDVLLVSNSLTFILGLNTLMWLIPT
jgi:NADPH:quinone reductase-like Zn-dependent oxidoreductase